MKRFSRLPAWVSRGVMMMASNALALDDFSTFTMKGVGNDVDPFELSCKQYNGLDAGTRRLVTAFLEATPRRGQARYSSRRPSKISRAASWPSAPRTPAKRSTVS